MMMTEEQREELIGMTHEWKMDDEARADYVEQLWCVMQLGMDNYFDSLLLKRTNKDLKLAEQGKSIVGHSKDDLLEQFQSTTKH